MVLCARKSRPTLLFVLPSFRFYPPFHLLFSSLLSSLLLLSSSFLCCRLVKQVRERLDEGLAVDFSEVCCVQCAVTLLPLCVSAVCCLSAPRCVVLCCGLGVRHIFVGLSPSAVPGCISYMFLSMGHCLSFLFCFFFFVVYSDSFCLSLPLSLPPSTQVPALAVGSIFKEFIRSLPDCLFPVAMYSGV